MHGRHPGLTPHLPTLTKCFSQLHCLSCLSSFLILRAPLLPPRWSAQMGCLVWPSTPHSVLITPGQLSSLAFELLRRDSQEMGENTWVSQKHLEEDIMRKAPAPPLCSASPACNSGLHLPVAGVLGSCYSSVPDNVLWGPLASVLPETLAKSEGFSVCVPDLTESAFLAVLPGTLLS